MKVYRGPKSTESLQKTDEINLFEEVENFQPNQLLPIDINLSKDLMKASEAGISFDENDFELFHNNYVIYLKQKVKLLESQVLNQKKALMSISNLTYNAKFELDEELNCIQLIEEVIRAIEVNDEIPLHDRLNFSDVLDFDGLISFDSAIIKINYLENKFYNELYGFIRNNFNGQFAYRPDDMEIFRGFNNKEILDQICIEFKDEKKLLSEWLFLTISIIKKDVMK